MRANRERYIASFDTEDDGAGNPYLWAIIHEKGAWYTFKRTKALEYILTLARDVKAAGMVLELWATNLEYDLVNLYGEDRLHELSFSFGKSYLVGALWPEHNVIFRDTVRHIPLSVRELGELVGIPKLEMQKEQGENVAYCVRDATITRRTAKWLDALYKEFGIAPKQTLASSALTIWREKYWRQDVTLPTEEIYTNAKQAYYGGRTEAFAIGSWDNVRVLDVASMFPWAMMHARFPLPWGKFKRRLMDCEPQETGFYLASIDCDYPYPFLPVRTNKGTAYPTGKWEAWYSGIELIAAKARGIGVRIKRGYEFVEECEPFKGYVTDFFRLKNEAKGPARLGYKLLLNSLYGKFGQTGEKVVAMPIDKFAQLANPPADFRVWNRICIYSVKGAPPPWGNNVWPMIITATARVRLQEEMEKVRAHGGTVLYCDTDSIIFCGAESLEYPEKAAKAGDFELRGRYQRIHIAGKKEYGLLNDAGEWEIHVKGVPLAAREEYLFTGRAEYQKPNRMREAARRGLKANVWSKKLKERRTTLDDRARRADGTLSPITIGAMEGQDNG